MSDQNPDDLKIKGQQKAAWDDSAEGWKRWWPTFERAAQLVNDRLVELAGVRAGNRVLDIATGSGEPALTAARAVGQSGRVVAVDMSPGMLAIARERIDAAAPDQRRSRRVRRRVAAPRPAFLRRRALPMGPHVHARPRRRRARDASRTQARRTLRDRSLVGGGQSRRCAALARDAIRRITGIVPPPNAPDPTRLADTSILERALAAAGFHDVTIERLIVTFEFPSAGRIRRLPRTNRRHPRDALENARRRRPPGA